TKPHDVYELFILLSNACTKALNELKPLVNRVFLEYDGYRFRLHYMHQVKEALKQGNLFYYQICILNKPVYRKQGSNDKLITEPISIFEMLRRSKQLFLDEIDKTNAF